MIILHQGERVNIVAKETEVIKGEKHFYGMYRNRLYDVDSWKCVDGAEGYLYANLRRDVTDNIGKAESEFSKVSAMFKQSTPAPATKQTTGSVGDKLEDMLLKVIAEQSIETIVETVKPEIDKHIVETFGVLPQIHKVVTPAAEHEIKGAVHECFDTVLNLVNMDIPVFLSGAAGTGKNVICKQVAGALGYNFYFTNAVTQEYQLKGFIDANGTYHDTQFYKAFTEGGLFFLDEMDGSIPETLIILNAAIANRYFDFPTGKVDANPNFRVIAAGNTVGTGADIEYTGRFQLDASSLDRFALIEVGYSPAIENAVTNGNSELCEFAREFRKITEKSSIRCLFTYRALERIAKLEAVFDLAEVLKMSLTKGLGVDDLKIIAKQFNTTNKYIKALKKLAE